jgi:hypothetical protein
MPLSTTHHVPNDVPQGFSVLIHFLGAGRPHGCLCFYSLSTMDRAFVPKKKKKILFWKVFVTMFNLG